MRLTAVEIGYSPHLEPTMMGQAPWRTRASPTPEACRLYQKAAKTRIKIQLEYWGKA